MTIFKQIFGNRKKKNRNKITKEEKELITEFILQCQKTKLLARQIVLLKKGLEIHQRTTAKKIRDQSRDQTSEKIKELQGMRTQLKKRAAEAHAIFSKK